MIAGFLEWATAAQLVKSAPLSELEGTSLAIDAEYYIDKLLSDVGTREPLLPALGGMPFVLESQISSQITVLKENKITPYFVFNGLNVNRQRRKLVSSLEHSKNVSHAWDLYNQSDPEQAVTEFGQSCMFHLPETADVRKLCTDYL